MIVNASTMEGLGEAGPGVMDRLERFGWDHGALQPWKDPYSKRTYVTIVNKAGKEESHEIRNANSLLTKDAWIDLTQAVNEVARAPHMAFEMLVGMGLSTNVKNPMGKTVFQHQNSSDSGNAVISMFALKSAPRDRAELELTGVPNPIIHGDVQFDRRTIAVANENSDGMNLIQTEAANVTDKITLLRDKLFIGTISTTPYYGGYYAYGLVNYPGRTTGTSVNPASVGWTPDDTVNDVINMVEAARLQNITGPLQLWYGSAYIKAFQKDYSAAKGDNTLMDRVKKINRVASVEFIDNLGANDLVLFSARKRTVEIMNGMGPTPIMWSEHGGFLQFVKIICMQNPRVREDFNGQCGIIHYSF